MALIADMLLIAGAIGAAVYCHVLSRRLHRFTNLESGVGGAVAVLSVQVDDLTRALESARATSQGSVDKLEALTVRAEAVAGRIELLMASTQDLSETSSQAHEPVRERRVRRNRHNTAASGGSREQA